MPVVLSPLHACYLADKAVEPLTISVGMAAMNESLESGFQLVELADEALYAAKRAGKNRVMVHSG